MVGCHLGPSSGEVWSQRIAGGETRVTGEELRSFEWIAGFNKLEAVGEVKSADVRAWDTAHERHYHPEYFYVFIPFISFFSPSASDCRK